MQSSPGIERGIQCFLQALSEISLCWVVVTLPAGFVLGAHLVRTIFEEPKVFPTYSVSAVPWGMSCVVNRSFPWAAWLA